MKIAISAQDNNPEGAIDQRFGRCKYYVIVETENKEIKSTIAIENQGAIQAHGAGIKSAEQIGQLGIDLVITGDLGPNATTVLKQLGIKSYHAGGNIGNAIKDYLDNKLEEIDKIAAPHSKTNLNQKNANEKIFFPLLNNNGENSEISGHFGHAPFFGIYNVEKKELKVIQNNLDHTNPNKSPIDQIVETINPTIIYATGIGGRALDLIKQKGIKLKTSNDSTVKEVIENLDKLSDQTSNCGH